MPMLANPRHEKFAQLVAQGVNQTQAYKESGFTAQGEARRRCASSLMTKRDVRTRVDEIRAEIARKNDVTIDELVKMARAAYAVALQNKQTQAAIAAVKALGVLSGHWIERKESDNRNENVTISAQPMSEDEWLNNHSENEAAH